MESAARRWESVIVGDVPSSAVTFGAGACVAGAPAYAGTIDDLLVDVIITPIDGLGGILGQAGPCFVRTADSLPMYGIILLDSADAADLVANDYFAAVVVHELGHILGFGTLWDYNRALLDRSNSADPRFVGTGATAAWRTLGGSGSVPVEAGGGPGTALSHWSESVFNNELMTGYLSQTNQLSRVTIGSMNDLGYVTDPSAADPYGLPSLTAKQMSNARAFELGAIQPGPPPTS